MKTVLAVLPLAVLLAGSASALAAPTNPNLGRNLAASCANCHGTQGRSIGGMPALAGEPREKTAASLRAFKAGTKSATVMHQLAKGYTDAQIDALAEFFSTQPAGGAR